MIANSLGWFPLLLAIPLLLLIIGGAMLWYALRAHGVCLSRRCTRCGHAAGPTRSLSCARCGAGLTDSLNSAARGEARRRLGVRAAFALALIVLGFNHLERWYRRWSQIQDWRSHEAQVLKDLRHSSFQVQHAALRELLTRGYGILSEEAMTGLAEFCLDGQAAPVLDPQYGATYLSELESLYCAGRLTPAQAERFLSQLCRVSAELRPQAVRGREMECRVRFENRFYQADYSSVLQMRQVRVDCEVKAVCIDGVPTDISFPPYEMRQRTESRNEVIHLAAPEVGRHVLSLYVVWTITRDDDTLRFFARTATLHLRFEVFESEPPGYLVEVDPPDWASVLERAIEPGGRYTPARAGQPARLSLFMAYHDEIPRVLVYDLIIADPATGRESVLGPVRLEPNPEMLRSGGRHLRFDCPGAPPPRTATIILRGSRKSTERTTDLSEYWNGEARFENVPIAQPASAPAIPSDNPDSDQQ